ncbi:MAG TPA: molybdopterin-dependent oxidoreductase [Candidatus Acidoferrum sp.]|nr:molybdopterin-dependent oxidoreductase [Candidatus Acidoferrum sp.]
MSIAGGAICIGLDRILLPIASLGQTLNLFAGGEMLGIMPFAREGAVPMDTAVGEELDGRLYTDLTSATREEPVTAAGRFYIRTRASSLLRDQDLQSILLRGLAGAPLDVRVGDLRAQARPMGTHLMECAGNTREGRFGLISVADWTGIPLAEVLQRIVSIPKGARILVSGFDRYASQSANSTAGASWIFSVDDIRATGAFLATGMDGQPLTRDHGAPVRLVVPGWYGCACIKWLNEIRVVPDSAEITSQMQEFAFRTMQRGSPKLAREYQAPVIDQSAMVTRVEKWRVGERIRYRVAGIMWGGTDPVKRLEIRFNPEEDYISVDEFQQSSNDPWNFWSHSWSPAAPGTYLLRLRVAEPAMQTRRLDMGFYMREVEISEI